jgi:hypothetical protein
MLVGVGKSINALFAIFISGWVIRISLFIIWFVVEGVKNRYNAIRIVIIPFGWLYNFLVIIIISSVIIVSYLAVSFLSSFIQFSVIIILGIVIMVVNITLVDSESISFAMSLPVVA